MTLAARPKEEIKAEAIVILQAQGALETAKYLAKTLFDGRMDKGGTPYFGHLERVARGVQVSGSPALRDAIRTIAYLHDLVEDIVDDPAQGIVGWTCQDLAEIGFGAFVIDGVHALTKSSKEAPYFDEMVRLGQSPQAIPVKKSDLRDNSNILRVPHLPNADDIERLRKYYLSNRYLSDVESGQTMPGTSFISWMRTQPGNRQDWDLLKKYSKDPEVLALRNVSGLFSAPAP